MSAAVLIERDFAVPDIRCAGCIAKLEQGLVRDKRIAAARDNFTEKRVHLSYMPDTHLPGGSLIACGRFFLHGEYLK